MDSISYTALRSKLASIMDRVCDDHVPVQVTRQNARAVVVMSLADYEAMAETAYLLRSPANAARLGKSIQEIEAGKVKEKELLE